MRVDPPTPCAEALLAIARDALLDHLDRGDARHALRLLLAALQQRTRGTLQPAGAGRRRQRALDRGRTRPRRTRRPPPPAALAVERLGGGWVALLRGRRRPRPGAGAGAAAAGARRAAAAATASGADGRRRRAHAALIARRAAGADTFVWEWDIDSDWLGDIDEGLEQLGYARGESGARRTTGTALIHPDDRAANARGLPAPRARRGRRPTNTPTACARSDGRWRWMPERGRIVERHADGRPRRMVGTQTDITAQREREQAASQATRGWRASRATCRACCTSYELAPGRRQRFPTSASAARELFGLDRRRGAADDSQVLWRAVDADDRAACCKRCASRRAALSEWRCEFRVHRRDGQQRWMLGTATPERSADGGIVWHGYMRGRHRAPRTRAGAPATPRWPTPPTAPRPSSCRA